MRRFFVGQNVSGKGFTGFSVGKTVPLDPQQSKHAMRVLRLEAGQKVQLVDGSGQLAEGEILQLKPVMEVRIEQITVMEPPKPRLTLACAIPKGGRADDMVNQLCQLGLDELIPLNTDRSVVEPKANKIERFERIIVEASKQCGRTHQMMVRPAMAFEALANRTFDEKRIGLPDGETLGPPAENVSSLLIVIGPEGGFTTRELEFAEKNNIVRWRFSPYILRIETAAVASLSIIRSKA